MAINSEPPGLSERLLSMLLNELDGMVYLCSMDEPWTMEFVSEGSLQVTGYKPEELINNSMVSFLDLIHPDDRDQVKRKMVPALPEPYGFSIEYRLIRADGSARWVWQRGRFRRQSGNGRILAHGFIQDISDRYFREKSLSENEQRYRSFFENASDGIFQSIIEGHYLNVNPALARIYGYTSPDHMLEDLQNIERQLYVAPGRREQFIRIMREESVISNFESQVFRHDGSIIWISENAREVRDSNGRLLYYEGTVKDISERRSYEQLISYQATHDNLTDLPNRTLLLDRIQNAIYRAERNGLQVAVVFIDLDHFKNVNDSIGHSAGDELIKLVAGRLNRCLRKCDTAARLGGDEFVVLLTDIKKKSKVVAGAIQRILKTIEEPCIIANREYLITGSIGVSLFPKDGDNPETLLKNADMAMYKAKQTGRNMYRFFTPDLNRRIAERLQLEQQLRIAVNEQQFVLHYQSKIEVATNRLVGAEALIRWCKPGSERPVSPGYFIPLAEETGLINPLGQWIVDQACRQLRSWLDDGIQVVPVSVNLSAKQFQHPGLAGLIEDAIRVYGIKPELLVFEVTESCFALEEDIFLRTLYDLKKLGVSLAIDDFGTGYSNMYSLKTMPLDFLKIDRSFISSVETDSRDRSIYRAIMAMAQHLGLRVVAEGVENSGQLEFLQSIGCNEVQGYFFGSPMSAEEYEKIYLSELHYGALPAEEKRYSE